MEVARLDEMATAFYPNACDGDIPSASMLLRIIEMRGRLYGLFDKEHHAARLTITDGANGEPKTLSVEFVMPGGRIASMDDPLPASSNHHRSIDTPASDYYRTRVPSSPVRIKPSPDDVVIERADRMPSAFRKRGSWMDWCPFYRASQLAFYTCIARAQKQALSGPIGS